jgi:hypothetical protein
MHFWKLFRSAGAERGAKRFLGGFLLKMAFIAVAPMLINGLELMPIGHLPRW